VLGAVLTVGGTALVGYIVLTREGMMGTIEEKANSGSEEPVLQFDDEVKAMSVMQWGQEVLASLNDLSGSEIGALEKVLGTSLISQTIEDAIGISADKIKTSTLDNLGKTVGDNLTLNIAKQKFGINFPSDIPLFNDEEFLATPLTNAFENFTDHKLNEVILMGEDTNAALLEMGDLAIKDLQGNAATEKINGMCLCQLMTINETSSKILQALKYCSIESRYANEEHTEYETKTITEIVDGVEVTKEVPLMGINDRVETLLISEVVEIDDNSNIILRKMRDENLKVTELGGEKVTDIVNNTKIGEIIEVKEEGEEKSEPILIALKDTTVNGLNDKMKTLKLNELFSEEKLSTGALSLIDPDTAIPDIPAAMTNVMINTTTATMIAQGLITSDLSQMDSGTLKKEQKSFILNSDVGSMMSGLVDFVVDPYKVVGSEGGTPTVHVNYEYIAPAQSSVNTATYNSLTEFVQAYTQFSTVTFGCDVTVNIDENVDGAYLCDIGGTATYCIPVFNGKTASDTENYSVTFKKDGAAADVKLAIFDGLGTANLTLAKNQFAYCYFENVTVIAGAFAKIGELTTAEFAA